MRRYLSTEFAVGTFALLGLLVVIYMSLEVNDRSAVGYGANTYTARFDTVSGIFRKVPVEVAGIISGFVEEIELVDNRAQVTVKMSDKVKVYGNAVLTLRDRGVLGDKFLLLNPGTSDHPLLPDGSVIPKTYSQGDLEQLTQSLGQTTEIIKELLQSDQPKGALGQIVVNLRDLTGRMNEVVGHNQDRINSILANMDGFSRDLNEITGENKDQIHAILVALNDVAVAMKGAIGPEGSVNRAAERIDQTVASLQKIVEKVERGEGTVGKLINDETTVDNLNTALEGVNETLGMYNRIQLGIRYRGEYLLSDERFQHLIGFKVAPAPDRFLLFEVVDAPAGETQVVDTVVTSNGNVISSTQTVQTDDRLLFSLMLGKRFWDLTFRAGLVRNEGGIGLDYHLLKDKLLVSFEAFDFSRVNDRARLRGYGTFILYKHLILTGGVDDMITRTGRRNAFFGAGLQFSDNDFKALISAIPAAF